MPPKKQKDRTFRLMIFFIITIVIFIIFDFSMSIYMSRNGFLAKTVSLNQTLFRYAPPETTDQEVLQSVSDSTTNEAWKVYNDIVLYENLHLDGTYWYSFRLPERNPEQNSLLITVDSLELDVFANGQKIYQYEYSGNSNQIWNWHLISLTNVEEQVRFFVKIHVFTPIEPTPEYIGIGTRDEVFQLLIGRDIPTIALSGLLFSLGFFSILIYLFNRKQRLFLSFAFFNIFIATYSFSMTAVKSFAINHYTLWEFANLFSFWLIAFVIPFFVENILENRKYKKIVSWLWKIHLILMVVSFAILTPIFSSGKNPVSALIPVILVFTIFVFLSIVIMTICLAKEMKKGSPELKLFFIGFILFEIMWQLDYIMMEHVMQFDFLQIGAFVLIVSLTFILYRRFSENKRKLEEYSRNLEVKVEERTRELEEHRDELEQANEELIQTLEKLRIAQERLVTQEKLASMGNLTAGIAHEIKNPLNFINNFSSISLELLMELSDEFERVKPKLSQDELADMQDLIESARENSQKVLSHGRRADSIVKSMMLHSRGKSGDLKLTNIHQLIEEYLNLAYHGMRAINPEFNIDIKTNFYEMPIKINVVPQDLGRAILNLLNNSFYAIIEFAASQSQEYKPEVVLTTRISDNYCEIAIRDNGPGISDTIKDKLFEPFFTTKPAGQGVGLGLSIVYDVIVQEHYGKIEIETDDDKFTEFHIFLPMNGE